MTTPKPALPEPDGYFYEVDGYFGIHRQFDTAPYNGMRPHRTVGYFTADTTRAAIDAAVAEARAVPDGRRRAAGAEQAMTTPKPALPEPVPPNAEAMNQEAQALAEERDEVLRQLDDRTNQTWVWKRQRWAALVRRQAAEIDRLAAMAQPPAGWVMVPVEPTPEMLFAVRNGPMRETWADGYRAMLSAAPKPEDTK